MVKTYPWFFWVGVLRELLFYKTAELGARNEREIYKIFLLSLKTVCEKKRLSYAKLKQLYSIVDNLSKICFCPSSISCFVFLSLFCLSFCHHVTGMGGVH